MKTEQLKLPPWVDNHSGLRKAITNIAKQLITLTPRKETSERGYRKTCEAITHVNALMDCLQDIRQTLPVELYANLLTLDGKGLADREQMLDRLDEKQRDWFALGMRYEPSMIVLLGIQQKLHELNRTDPAYNKSNKGQPRKHAIAYCAIDIEDLLLKHDVRKEWISEVIEAVFAFAGETVPSDATIKNYRKG